MTPPHGIVDGAGKTKRPPVQSISTSLSASSAESPIHPRFDAAAKAAQRGSSISDEGHDGGARSRTRASDTSNHLRAHKTDRAANDAEARFKNYVLNRSELASTELTKFTPTQLEAWRKALKELPTRVAAARRAEIRMHLEQRHDLLPSRAEPGIPGWPDHQRLRMARASFARSRTPIGGASCTSTVAQRRNVHREGASRPRGLPPWPDPVAPAAWGPWPGSPWAITTSASTCSRSARTRQARTDG